MIRAARHGSLLIVSRLSRTNKGGEGRGEEGEKKKKKGRRKKSWPPWDSFPHLLTADIFCQQMHAGLGGLIMLDQD